MVDVHCCQWRGCGMVDDGGMQECENEREAGAGGAVVRRAEKGLVVKQGQDSRHHRSTPDSDRATG